MLSENEHISLRIQVSASRNSCENLIVSISCRNYSSRMDAASSSQYFGADMNCCEKLDINPCQLLEQMMALILEYQGFTYTPILAYETEIGLNNLPAIVSTILEYFEIMLEKYESHFNDVAFALLILHPKTEEYIEIVGKSLLIDRQFNWENFRVFLALVCKLGDVLYAKNKILFYNDVILTASCFIEKNIQSRVNELQGWKSFEEDCVEICKNHRELNRENRERMVVEEPSQKVLVSSELPASTSTKCMENRKCNFKKETFKRRHHREISKEVGEFLSAEKIVHLGDTQPQATVKPPSWEEVQTEMAAKVRESIEVSWSAVKHIHKVRN